MIKVNPIKTIALATALSAGVAASAQNNRLQENYRQFLTEEFRKADINPKDYFVSQAELNAYMGNEDTKVANFDTNNDNSLNIDEFGSIITGKKVSPAQQETPQSQVVQTRKTSHVQEAKKTRAEIKKDAYDIAKELNHYTDKKTKTVTVPGFLWGTNSYQTYDENKIVSTIKRINKDNIFDVTNIFCNTYLVASKANVSHICILSDRTIGYNKQNIYGHLCSIIQEVADEKGVGTDVRNILQRKDSQVSKMHEAYNIISSM